MLRKHSKKLLFNRVLRFMTQFTLVSEHKSLFGLTGGSLGVGLKPVPLIEYVCIVSNCPLPPVIREHGSSEWFEVISQCYVWRVSHVMEEKGRRWISLRVR